MEKITLTKPIVFNNITYKELIIKQPKVKDIKLIKFEDNNMSGSIRLMSVLTGLPDLAVEELELSDYVKIQGIIDGFFQMPQLSMKN